MALKGFSGPDQRGDDAEDAAKDSRGDPLCFGEGAHQADRTLAGALEYRKYVQDDLDYISIEEQMLPWVWVSTGGFNVEYTPAFPN